MAEYPTPSKIRTFLAVVRTGSVRAAAAELYVTEPAVSAAIGQLAQQLNAELFVKEGRALRLTSAGEMYASYGRDILGLMDEAASAVTTLERAHLRIGAVATASEVVLPAALSSFALLHPDVTLHLSVAPRDDLFDLLRHREVDLAVCGRPPRGSGLVARATRTNSLILVGAPQIAAHADLSRTQWLMRGEGSGVRQTTTALFDQLAIAPPTLTLGTHGAVVASARAGLGITLVHEDAVAADLETGALTEIPSARTPMARPWIVATNKRVPPQAQIFLDHLTSGSRGVAAFHPVNRPRGGVA